MERKRRGRGGLFVIGCVEVGMIGKEMKRDGYLVI
jgi:hypothetical protein